MLYLENLSDHFDILICVDHLFHKSPLKISFMD